MASRGILYSEIPYKLIVWGAGSGILLLPWFLHKGQHQKFATNVCRKHWNELRSAKEIGIWKAVKSSKDKYFKCYYKALHDSAH